MNSLFRSSSRRFLGVLQATFAAIFILFTISASAQQPQLTLADLLIGLRSKKVTLEERNVILAGAVRDRGVTFSITPEIEKELIATGASKTLLDAVREKAIALAPAATPTPVPTPTQDFSYFKTRADANLGKGEFALALPDYDKALSLQPDSSIAFLNRGRTYYNLKDYTRAGSDFDRAIELDPKDSKAYYNRGVLYERENELEKALADYQKAADLDPTNEPAKVMAKKVADQLQAKAAPPIKAPVVEPPKVEAPPKRPEWMNVGALSPENAVKMVKPLYPQIAQRSSAEGKVVVEVELDAEGNVVDSKAVSGNQFLRAAAEEAAKKSKFHPAMFNGEPIKAKGTITYIFNLRPGSE